MFMNIVRDISTVISRDSVAMLVITTRVMVMVEDM